MRPLEGIKVLDLSRVLAGPYATMVLADMGADVVKVEQPGRGDDTRIYGPPFIHGESTYFMSVNRGKRSLTLNFKQEQGLAALRGLATRADILVQNFRPGKMADFGLDYPAASAANPGLIYCSISGYGHTGPEAHLPGYDVIVQGEGGIASLTGDPDGPPYKVGTSQADLVAGMNAVQGILLALIVRQRTGRGQHIDISLLDSQVGLLTYQAGIYFATGQSPTRMGNRHPSIAPYQTYASANGWINLGCGNDRLWRAFCRATGLEQLLSDPRFTTNADRVAHREALDEVIIPLMATRTTEEWVTTLRAAGIPCGAINSVGQVLEHPQIRAREMVVALDHATAGPIRLTGIPIKLSETPGRITLPPPPLGAHTADVLADWLQLGPEEIATLQATGAT